MLVLGGVAPDRAGGQGPAAGKRWPPAPRSRSWSRWWSPGRRPGGHPRPLPPARRPSPPRGAGGRSGYLTRCDALDLGIAAMAPGAGARAQGGCHPTPVSASRGPWPKVGESGWRRAAAGAPGLGPTPAAWHRPPPGGAGPGGRRGAGGAAASGSTEKSPEGRNHMSYRGVDRGRSRRPGAHRAAKRTRWQWSWLGPGRLRRPLPGGRGRRPTPTSRIPVPASEVQRRHPVLGAPAESPCWSSPAGSHTYEGLALRPRWVRRAGRHPLRAAAHVLTNAAGRRRPTAWPPADLLLIWPTTSTPPPQPAPWAPTRPAWPALPRHCRRFTPRTVRQNRAGKRASAPGYPSKKGVYAWVPGSVVRDPGRGGRWPRRLGADLVGIVPPGREAIAPATWGPGCWALRWSPNLASGHLAACHLSTEEVQATRWPPGPLHRPARPPRLAPALAS